MSRPCGTGRPFPNRTRLAAENGDFVPPRLFWAVAGSGLSLRRRSGSDGWRFDCPCDPLHSCTLAYRARPGRTDPACGLRCHANDGSDDGGCTAAQILTALGCEMRDFYRQPTASADGPCHVAGCDAAGYRVAGVARQRPVCLRHLLDATRQPRTLLFEDA